MLTGKQIIDQGIVFLDNENHISHESFLKDGPQQHSVDLNLIKVQRLDDVGFIPKEGKTVLCKRIEVRSETEWNSESQREVWNLSPGAYDITFAQGCKIPNNFRLRIVQRSSLLRNGGLVNSSIFDSGFKTDQIGTIFHINNPIKIEVGARIATAYTEPSNIVEEQDLYSGQYQSDIQRTNI